MVLLLLLIKIRQNREKLLNFMLFIASRYLINVNLYFSLKNKKFKAVKMSENTVLCQSSLFVYI